MVKQKKESYFWTSYSDMMTSLFFIMLTLFVITVVLLNKKREVSEKRLNEIEKIQKSTQELETKGGYFEYNEQYEKFALRIDVFFPELQTDFSYLSQECRNQLDEAGDQIVAFLKRKKKNKYLLIIEGQASLNSYKWMDRNYELSFERAKNLMKFWLPKFKSTDGIDDPLYAPTIVDNCEIQIAGSGDGRLNVNSMRDPIEENNQRFLIYIIPKNIMHNDSTSTK